MVRNLFTEEHTIFRDAFGRYLEREVVPHYEKWEEEGIVPCVMWKKMGWHSQDTAELIFADCRVPGCQGDPHLRGLDGGDEGDCGPDDGALEFIYKRKPSGFAGGGSLRKET
ncbi:MAG: acyl-CoA dehydrogenase family protein [Syntrophales bacterium]|jgi:hypothetical protein|nr:acyl-CoA dehydrogenase family protein [Syntrophales bacterium]MCK9390721.1 acyl-CoA dehydrogenase family protein [Syntrophales bacterium]